MDTRKLTHLPDEILRSICFCLDWRDILSLNTTCRRFGNVSNEHLLWKHFCHTVFRYWSASHNISAKSADLSFLDWKLLFQKRHEADLKTRSTLQEIISSQTARTPKIEAIVGLGYDSKKVLLENHARASQIDDHLARRYWSHVALGCLHRSIALEEWSALREGAQKENAFERSVGALDLFVLDDSPDGDLDDIFHRLNDYVARIRHAHPDIDEQSPRQKAITVAQYLLSNNLVSIPEDREYHNIEHNFLGRALFTDGKNSLPIVTVIIYCYIVRQFGLRAAPCDFPLHVHALVHPPAGMDLEGNPLPSDTTDPPSLYMDPFRSSKPVPISSLHERLDFLSRHPITPADRATFLSASASREITLRCARNIINSLQRRNQAPAGPRIDPTSAHYAARWAFVLLDNRTAALRLQALGLMQFFAENFPHDVGLVEKHMLPLTDRAGSERAQICRGMRMADLHAPVSVKRRVGNPAARNVKYRIGQVFLHKRLGYKAVVTGWDGRCDADEEWIQRMGVDGLEGGRQQAFYHAFVQDDKSMRYVAQENIDPLLTEGDGGVSDGFPLEIGKWFKRWDREAGVFVSNVRDEYPDD